MWFWGRSTSFRSPIVASSRHRFCSVSLVRLMTVTSSTMSYWCTVTYASAYTGSAKPAHGLVLSQAPTEVLDLAAWIWPHGSTAGALMPGTRMQQAACGRLPAPTSGW